MKRQQKKRGLLVTLVLAVVLGTSSYAFTASNTIANAGNAGDGNGGTAIGGYTVTAVHYDSSDSSHITSVKFNISPSVDPVNGVVKASINGGALSSGCVDVSVANDGSKYNCDVSGDNITIGAAAALRVVAFG
jgi:hypothetical protein